MTLREAGRALARSAPGVKHEGARRLSPGRPKRLKGRRRMGRRGPAFKAQQMALEAVAEPFMGSILLSLDRLSGGKQDRAPMAEGSSLTTPGKGRTKKSGAPLSRAPRRGEDLWGRFYFAASVSVLMPLPRAKRPSEVRTALSLRPLGAVSQYTRTSVRSSPCQAVPLMK